MKWEAAAAAAAGCNTGHEEVGRKTLLLCQVLRVQSCWFLFVLFCLCHAVSVIAPFFVDGVLDDPEQLAVGPHLLPVCLLSIKSNRTGCVVRWK